MKSNWKKRKGHENKPRSAHDIERSGKDTEITFKIMQRTLAASNKLTRILAKRALVLPGLALGTSS